MLTFSSQNALTSPAAVLNFISHTENQIGAVRNEEQLAQSRDHLTTVADKYDGSLLGEYFALSLASVWTESTAKTCLARVSSHFSPLTYSPSLHSLSSTTETPVGLL